MGEFLEKSSEEFECLGLPDQVEGEPKAAYAAFCDYRALGPGRSIPDLKELYLERIKGSKKMKSSVPSTCLNTLYRWGRTYNWIERAAEYDKKIAEERLRLEVEEKRKQWRREVKSYRERNKKAGQAMFNLSILLTQKALKTLSSDDLDADQAIRTLSAISKLAESSQSLEGTALGIDQLLNDHIPE